MKIVIVLLFGLGLCLAGPAYRSRGWRPAGASFNPTASQIRPQRYYGPPAQGLTTTARPITTTERATTTTTERSREPTTPTVTVGEGSSEEEFEQNPALAIANSFAFNRPIYVYNAGFPFQPAAFTLLQ